MRGLLGATLMTLDIGNEHFYEEEVLMRAIYPSNRISFNMPPLTEDDWRETGVDSPRGLLKRSKTLL